MENQWIAPGDLPFHLEEYIGEIETATIECPGVYYIAVQPESGPFATEYYIVTPEANMISDRAKQYGQMVGNGSGLRLYRMDEPEKGRYIIDYEINRYRVKNGLPLPPQTSLRDI